MKFNVETNEVCRVKGEEITEIFNRMYAISDNLEFIFNTLHEQYPNDKLSKEFSTQQIVFHIDQITVDLCNQVDEFYIEETGLEVFTTPIEVVTKEVAESNDKDFVNLDNGYSQEEVKSYEVGGTLSDYTKLGNSEYYFKFM